MRDPQPLAACAPKLALLVPRLGSNHDGEVLATAAAIKRVLAGQGLDLHDLATVVRSGCELPPPESPAAPFDDDPPPDELGDDNWRQVVRWLQRRPGVLTKWERDFTDSLSTFRKLSAKQLDCLDGIFGKVREARP